MALLWDVDVDMDVDVNILDSPACCFGCGVSCALNLSPSRLLALGWNAILGSIYPWAHGSMADCYLVSRPHLLLSDH